MLKLCLTLVCVLIFSCGSESDEPTEDPCVVIRAEAYRKMVVAQQYGAQNDPVTKAIIANYKLAHPVCFFNQPTAGSTP